MTRLEPPTVRQVGIREQLPSFVIIGLVCTVVQLVLYTLLRPPMGPVPANVVSYLLVAVVNTAANRRFTFGVSGSRNAVRHHIEGGAAFVLGLAASTGGLAVVNAARPGGSWLAEVGALLGCNFFAAVLRFLLLRSWVFHPRRIR
ncbi:hypothetical protein Pth03_71900 [Planotetraspora thailandica]|uniref:GtrA/DPMS transmembrane domain-containing protein n=2 Tax=Planotetraspora thailandica TaxID=487172 RepID=A0A8J4DE98_9ACTN|nr:hypothetical protein Pth03_71900 [Planotetraspora thailandica]